MQKENDFARTFHLTDLEPGQTYAYAVKIDGETIQRPYPLRFETEALWQYRRDPPAFTVAFGSCNYVNDPRFDRPGDPYGGGYRIFEEIARLDPRLMLWLGDNVYYRTGDFDAPPMMGDRYARTRAGPSVWSQSAVVRCVPCPTMGPERSGPSAPTSRPVCCARAGTASRNAAAIRAAKSGGAKRALRRRKRVMRYVEAGERKSAFAPNLFATNLNDKRAPTKSLSRKNVARYGVFAAPRLHRGAALCVVGGCWPAALHVPVSRILQKRPCP